MVNLGHRLLENYANEPLWFKECLAPVHESVHDMDLCPVFSTDDVQFHDRQRFQVFDELIDDCSVATFRIQGHLSDSIVELFPGRQLSTYSSTEQ